MNKIFLTVIEGAIAFAATNVDDLIILLLLFSQVNSRLRPHHIVGGSYWGFTMIVALSLVGFFGGFFISPAWIGLLGILPILLGLKRLVYREDDAQAENTIADFPNQSNRHPFVATLMQMLHPRSYQVAVITLANGSDNIGIYVPLFAAKDAMGLGIILIVFYLFLGVWCYAAYRFTRNPKIAYVLTRYGQSIVPFVLIGLGLFILWKKGTFKLLMGVDESCLQQFRKLMFKFYKGTPIASPLLISQITHSLSSIR